MSLLQLPPDVMRLLPTITTMSVRDILRFCRADPRINKAICNTDIVWNYLFRSRLSREQPLPSRDVIKRHLHTAETSTGPEKEQLALAAEHGYEVLLDTLLPEMTEEERDIATDKAAEKGHLSMVHKLLGAGVSERGINNAIESAAINGHLDIIRLINAEDVDTLVNALYLAAENGHGDIVDTFLNDPDFPPIATNEYTLEDLRNNTFSSAALSSNVNLLRKLFNDGVPQDAINNALSNALISDNIEVLRFILEQRPSRNIMYEVLNESTQKGNNPEHTRLILEALFPLGPASAVPLHEQHLVERAIVYANDEATKLLAPYASRKALRKAALQSSTVETVKIFEELGVAQDLYSQLLPKGAFNKDLFDYLLPKVQVGLSSALAYSLIVAAEYDRTEMFDYILSIVQQQEDHLDIVKEAASQISGKYLEKLLPYLTPEDRIVSYWLHILLSPDYYRREKRRELIEQLIVDEKLKKYLLASSHGHTTLALTQYVTPEDVRNAFLFSARHTLGDPLLLLMGAVDQETLDEGLLLLAPNVDANFNEDTLRGLYNSASKETKRAALQLMDEDIARRFPPSRFPE